MAVIAFAVIGFIVGIVLVRLGRSSQTSKSDTFGKITNGGNTDYLRH